MKRTKNLWKPLLLAGGILTLASCGQQGGQQDGQQAQPEQTREVAAPEQIISLETARGYYANYSERRAMLIRHYEDSINLARGIKDSFPVARYVAFDYKVIKEYMAYIEQEAAKVGTEPSTLRIYFANYPDEAKYDHPRQNSLFLIPTAEVGGTQYGLYINGEKPGYLNWQLQPWQPNGMGMNGNPGTRAEASFLPAAALQTGGKSLILNEGGSAPPPFN